MPTWSGLGSGSGLGLGLGLGLGFGLGLAAHPFRGGDAPSYPLHLAALLACSIAAVVRRAPAGRGLDCLLLVQEHR